MMCARQMERCIFFGIQGEKLKRASANGAEITWTRSVNSSLLLSLRRRCRFSSHQASAAEQSCLFRLSSTSFAARNTCVSTRSCTGATTLLSLNRHALPSIRTNM